MANTANISKTKIRIFAVLAVLMMAITPFIVPSEIQAASGDAGTFAFGTGRNNYGQMGQGDTNDVLSPEQIGDYQVSMFVASDSTAFFLSDGKVYGFGRNNLNQQGDGTTNDVLSPKRIGSFTAATSVVCSDSTTFVLEGGRLYGWGHNGYGQMGNGNTNDITTPTRLASSLGTITKVFCSDRTTFLVTSSGQLYGSGWNLYGQIGDGTSNTVTAFKRVASTISNVVDGQCTTYTTYFLTADGKLYGCGLNNYGQMARGNTNNVFSPAQIGSGVTSFDCSTENLVVLAGTTLYGTGRNNYGQFGNGGTTNILSLTRIGASQGAIAAAQANGATVIFQTSSGEMYGSGRNNAGQLGQGDTSDRSSFTRIGASLGTISFFGSSGATTLFSTTDGKLYGCGSNGYGQIGDGSTNNVLSPKRIGTGENTTGIVVGNNVTFYMDKPTYTATIQPNEAGWGTVSSASVTGIEYGDAVTVSGSSISIGSTVITATPSESTLQYDYSFTGWLIDGEEIPASYNITSDVTITAVFEREQKYTITVVSNNTDYGTVSPEYVYEIPFGSVITTLNNTFRVNGTTVTATPAESTEYNRYLFQSWSVLSGTQVTSDMTITATFERRGTDVTVTIVPNNPDYGSVSVGTFDYVPIGSVIDIVGSTLTIAGNVTTATAAESTLASQFDFAGYFIGATPITPGAAITSNTVITAVFLETPHLYNVPIRLNDPSYGTVDIARLENVPYGAVMTVSGTSITVNEVTVTATVADDNEQYRFSWAGWTYRGSTVVSGTTAVSGPSPIIATVDAVLQQYTVTWIIGETVETQTYSYGDWPSHETPDAPTEGEVFYWWEPRVTHVTGDAEYTAIFGPPHEMPDYTPLVGIVITLLIMAIMFGIYKSGHDITGRDVALAMLALVILLLMIPYMAG